jgi:hypothetical protein
MYNYRSETCSNQLVPLSIEQNKKEHVTKILVPFNNPTMGTRSKRINSASPAMSTRSKRRLSL